MGQYCDNIWPNERQHELYTDVDNYKVIMHIELNNEDKDTKNKMVTYQREDHKNKYKYLSAEETAKALSIGKSLKLCYLERIDFRDINIALGLPEDKPLNLQHSIFCQGCIIGQIYLHIENIDGDLDFSSYNPPNDSNDLNSLGDYIAEKNAVRTVILNSVFIHKGIGCKKANIKGRISFYRAIIFRSLNIAIIDIYGSMNFEHSRLYEHVFVRANTFGYNGLLDFTKSHLADIDIVWSDVSKSFLFENVKVDKSVRLTGLNIKGFATFHDSNIGQELSISTCDFNQNILFNSYNHKDMKINKLRFYNTIIRGKLVLDFEQIKSCNKNHHLGSCKITKNDNSYWESLAQQYRFLKEQYKKSENNFDEDNAHWWASECDRMCSKKINKKLLKIISTVIFISLIGLSLINNELLSNLCVPIILSIAVSAGFAFPRYGKYILFNKIFGYGVNPWNIVSTILIVIGLCALLFWIAGCGGDLSYSNLPFSYGDHFQTGLYFSVITFATVGFGDVSATGWAAGLAMVEGLLGVILNAALIVVLFRKLVR